MSLISSLRAIRNSLWDALPGAGPLFDDESGDVTDRLSVVEDAAITPKDERKALEGSVMRYLPDEVFLGIFRFLPRPEDLGPVARVCSLWNRLASDKSIWNAFDLRQLYPRLTIIDQPVWEEHVDLVALGLNFTGLPALDNRAIIPVLKTLLAPGVIEDDAGAAVLMMPNELDDDKLTTLAQNPKKGHPTQFRDISALALRRLREIPASKACIFIISNNVLIGSRDKPLETQQDLLRGIGCDMPEALPMATLAILTHIISGTRLYGDNPWTYTRCSEEVQLDGWGVVKLVVGGFALDGLSVSYYFDGGYYGVVALRKFPAIGT